MPHFSMVSSAHSTIEKNKERATLNANAAYASPELKTCDHRLRCIIEGIEKDQLLVRLSHVDGTDPGREFSFVMDVGSRSYRGACSSFYALPTIIIYIDLSVLTSTPLLPTLPIYVEELNKSRDVYVFIKQVRRAFQELVSQRK